MEVRRAGPLVESGATPARAEHYLKFTGLKEAVLNISEVIQVPELMILIVKHDRTSTHPACFRA